MCTNLWVNGSKFNLAPSAGATIFEALETWLIVNTLTKYLVHNHNLCQRSVNFWYWHPKAFGVPYSIELTCNNNTLKKVVAAPHTLLFRYFFDWQRQNCQVKDARPTSLMIRPPHKPVPHIPLFRLLTPFLCSDDLQKKVISANTLKDWIFDVFWYVQIRYPSW